MAAFKCVVLLLIVAIEVQVMLAQRVRVPGTSRLIAFDAPIYPIHPISVINVHRYGNIHPTSNGYLSNYGYNNGYHSNNIYPSQKYGRLDLHSNGYYAPSSNGYYPENGDSRHPFCKGTDQTSYGTCYCCLGGCSDDLSPRPQYDDCDRDNGWWSCCSD